MYNYGEKYSWKCRISDNFQSKLLLKASLKSDEAMFTQSGDKIEILEEW